MVEIFGKQYYIDIDAITDKCGIKNEESSGDSETQTINIFKYELVKLCIETVLSENAETDEKMGVFGTDSTTVSFKIAFNTLIKNEILIENTNEYE
jgi:hypothetical protein